MKVLSVDLWSDDGFPDPTVAAVARRAPALRADVQKVRDVVAVPGLGRG